MKTQFRSLDLLILAAVFVPYTPSIATALKAPQQQPAQQNFTPSTPKIALNPSELGQLRDKAQKITVRVTSANNGGSGVLVARKGTTYLVLTNQHVTRRDRQFQIKTTDGKQYNATLLPKTNIDRKYDVALLQFTSTTDYQLANLNNDNRPIGQARTIYSAGYPFDSEQLRFSGGAVSQLSDLPLEDGTQIGYAINTDEKGVRQGMSGGPILDLNGVVIGINTISVAPLLASYKYVDGSDPTPQKSAQYQQANWGVPIYNFLTQLNPNILYAYDNFPKVPHQVTPTGDYLTNLNQKTRQQTVRFEAGGTYGSGVIVAKEGNTYSVLTANHVVQNKDSKQLYSDIKTITFDQESHQIDLKNITVSKNQDLAIVKFTTSTSLSANSTATYPVAQLSRVKPRPDDVLFVGGYPARENINSPLWQWQFNAGKSYGQDFGKYATRSDQSFNEGGYNLVYTNVTYGGMSGGPVFDTEGRVIGLHGKAEEGDKAPELMLGNSLGISIKSFISMTDELKVNRHSLNIPKVQNPPRYLTAAELKTVADVRDSLPEPENGDGSQWIRYGGQLNRTKQYTKAIAAFDKAIAINPKIYLATGSYGKARAYNELGMLDFDLALDSGRDSYKLENFSRALALYSTAIANIPQNEQKQNYFLWRRRAGCLFFLKKYDEALQENQQAINLNPTDIILYQYRARLYFKKEDFKQAISIYDRLIQQQPNAALYNDRGAVKQALASSQQEVKDRPKRISGSQDAMMDFDLALKLDPEFNESYVHRAMIKEMLGDNRGALADINFAISYEQRNGLYYIVRSNIKSSLNDFKGVIDDCNIAISLKYNTGIVYLNRGAAKADLEDYKGAITDYTQSISIDPKNDNTYNMRGIAKRELKDYQGAIADFTQSISINPKISNTYVQRGNTKRKLKDYQGAIADFTQAIKVDPKNYLGYIGRGLVKSTLKDYQGAISEYTQSIAINPKYYLSYSVRGTAKFLSKDYQGAIADYTQSISINPKNYDDYYSRGNAKFQLKDYQGAISDLTQAIALNPKAALTYAVRAEAKYALKDYQGAIADFDRWITLDPKNDSAYNERGDAKLQLRDYQDAVTDYTKSISINPRNDAIYNARGLAKYQLGDYSGAIADAERALSINLKNDNAYSNQGFYKFLSNNNQGALTDWEQAIALNAKNSYAYANRGFYQVMLDNDRRGLIDIEKSIQLNSEVASSYAVRGLIRTNSGDRAGAVSDYKQALKINPKLVDDLTKDAKQLQRSNNLAAYQKYQKIIQDLTVQK